MHALLCERKQTHHRGPCMHKIDSRKDPREADLNSAHVRCDALELEPRLSSTESRHHRLSICIFLMHCSRMYSLSLPLCEVTASRVQADLAPACTRIRTRMHARSRKHKKGSTPKGEITFAAVTGVSMQRFDTTRFIAYPSGKRH